MSLEVDPLRRSQSDSLPSFFSDFKEGEHFQRRHPSVTRNSISTASPISPTTTMYSGAYATPPESRKNSKEDQPRLSLPSLHEVGLAAPPLPQHTAPSLFPPVTPHYPHHSHGPHIPPPAPPGPPAHSAPAPSSAVHPYHTPYPYPHQTSSTPQPGHPSEPPYRYHESRNPTDGHGGNQGPLPPPPPPPQPPPQPVHPNSDSYRQPHPYPPPQAASSSQYSPRSAPHGTNGANSSFSYTQTPAEAQYQYPAHQPPPATSQPKPPSTQSPYSQSMPPPYHPPYANETNGTHPPYAPGNSPQSKSLGKRPITAHGSAIDRALQVSSVRRDLDVVRNTSQSIYNLVLPLFEKEGAYNQHPSLEHVLAGFQKALQDAEQLKECLENFRRTLADMSKEYEEKSLQKGRQMPEYDAEDHGYGDDGRSVGSLQPESKKIRRGRAAPPGRCHSCHRAETPEWRRGPDGARTLCNACGLHYAKLTRKMSKNNLAPGSMTRKPGPTSPLA